MPHQDGDNDVIDFLEDADQVSATPEDLNRLNKLVQDREKLLADKDRVEQMLKDIDRDIRNIEQHKIPEIMHTAKMKDFTLQDGRKISLERKYTASISEAKKPDAFAWLDENGHQAIIKNIVSSQFDRSEHNQALSLVGELKERGFSVENKQSVHPSTLRAFVREQMEKGVDIPKKTFGIYVIDFAKIK